MQLEANQAQYAPIEQKKHFSILFSRLPVQDLPDVPVCRPDAVLEGGQADRWIGKDGPDPSQETSCKCCRFES